MKLKVELKPSDEIEKLKFISLIPLHSISLSSNHGLWSGFEKRKREIELNSGIQTWL